MFGRNIDIESSHYQAKVKNAERSVLGVMCMYFTSNLYVTVLIQSKSAGVHSPFSYAVLVIRKLDTAVALLYLGCWLIASS